MSSVRVDLGAKSGPVRPLHGVNNGPVGYGGLVDVGHYYRELSVPFVRLHDPNWPHPREVDIPQVFPDFDADPDDPASYDFDRTDRYIKRILDTGARIVYRLGTSIEHTEKKYYTHPPSDYDKWARICVGIIKHYTSGWADGMQEAVGYWEIWNEPDLPVQSMWSGSFADYLELYKVAAPAIKAACLNVKVGGYAAAYPGDAKVPQFLAFCREHNLPLDFFSWHTYAQRPEQIVDSSQVIARLLDEHGFDKTEVHFNEWNFMPADCGPVFALGSEFIRREVFEQQKNEIGASFVAATLALMQDLRIDVANYYDGQPMALYCGIFDYYGVPQKTYRAFKAFTHLLDYPNRAEAVTESEDGNLYALAAVDQDTHKAAVMISRFDGATDECCIEVAGLPEGKEMRCEVLMLDADRSMESVMECIVNATNPIVKLQFRRYSVALVKVW